ncbi:MFS transporter [Bacillus cereus group sp. BfR-BA-01380]|uniref:MFS transporter n=1 Tax=Bacillus cereus group sp. BfR-BA-01380 TaxID=2920324 RepID=UPI001F59CEBD|nr:MFS transporter [Bacillus cereus group sp. BfR-BA-01380]
MNKNLLFLYISKLISSLGDQIYVIALSVTLYKVTNSALITTGVITIKALVHFLGIFIYKAGNMKFQKSIAVIGDIVRCVLIVLLIPLIQIHFLFAYVIIFLLEVVQIYCASSRIILLNAVTDPKKKNNSNIIDQIIQTVAIGIGLALGGVVTYELNYKAALLVNAASFIISALLISFVKIQIKNNINKEKIKNIGLFQWFKAQDSGIKKDLITIFPFYSFSAVAFSSLLVVFVMEYLAKDERYYGYISGIMALGLFFGGLISLKVKTSLYYRSLSLSILVMGLCYVIATQTKSFIIISLFLFISSVANMIYASIHRTSLAELYKNVDIGNAWTFYRALSVILGAIGTIVFSLISDSFGIIYAMNLSGITLIVFGVFLVYKIFRHYEINQTQDFVKNNIDL